MLTELENYYFRQSEPIQSCLLALKGIVMGVNASITHERKYQIPFFYYKGKKLAYLWVTKKKIQMGFIEDKSLQNPVDGIKPKDKYQSIIIKPNEDIPLDIILQNLDRLIHLYENKV
ncbi:DUF1801 domain-containing protein [Emticicia sp. 17c]|uniref:DUF1801 domain-containing protein n=1 Tax=Emticicia sp. 17c TaxID=3127704 RepID=UPI00301DBC78